MTLLHFEKCISCADILTFVYEKSPKILAHNAMLWSEVARDEWELLVDYSHKELPSRILSSPGFKG